MANLAPTWRAKTFQNRGRNPKKSMLKHNTCSASILGGFGPCFGRVFGRFFGHVFNVSPFVCIFGPKNLPKTLPKRSPNPSKIDAENVLFFNIDFFGSRPRFWRVLGLQDGAKLAPKGDFQNARSSLFAFLS